MSNKGDERQVKEKVAKRVKEKPASLVSEAVQATANSEKEKLDANQVSLVNAEVDEGEAQAAQPLKNIVVNVKSLLDAGAHFGHQTERWNPKMLPYIFCERNGVHIINLDITNKLWQRARRYVIDTVSRGGSVLVVATKLQAREIAEREAKRCRAFHVTRRWLGGTLTNFETVKNSIERMKKMEEYLAKAEDQTSELKLKKKEKLNMSRQLGKLDTALGGIRQMRKQPDLIFVVDILKEQIAVSEARRLHIPVMALVDTNVDPSDVQFPIPSNDDASKTLELFLVSLADAVIEGRAIFDVRRARDSENTRDKGSRNKDHIESGSDKEGSVRDESSRESDEVAEQAGVVQ
jgi:small subunit ribosomal protein S2